MRYAGLGGFILAAGEGRRLRPATLVRPKALVPFCGVPLLELVASQMQGLVSEGVVVNACYLADEVGSAATALSSRLGVAVHVSRETRLLDTGGGLRQGLEFLPKADHILVHNVDVILDFDLRRLIDFHLSNQAAATLLLIPGAGPRTVDLHYDRRIRHFRRPWGEGEYTFSGVHVLRRDVLEHLPAEDACSVVRAYESALAADLPVLGYVARQTYWSDLGTPQSYIRAHGEISDCGLRNHPQLRTAQAEQARRRAALEQTGVRCTGALGLGAGVRAPQGAHLHNVVLWDNTILTQPVLYADSVFVGGEVGPPPAVDESRRPDPRIFACLDLDPDRCQVKPLRKQGSGRRYCRLCCGDRSWVWCAYTHGRRENASYAAISDFLSRLGLRVPQVELHLADTCEVLSRDLGHRDLQQADSPQETEEYLRDVVQQVARLHVLGDRELRIEEFPLQNGFTKGLYDWERDYFREHILDRFLSAPELWGPVAEEYREIRNVLLCQPQVPIHRDLQSANIMVADGKPHLIDFQGLRLGCAAYDLGALLYDPYRAHPIDLRWRLWLAYKEQVQQLGGTPPADAILGAAAIQRLLQCLGAYGKLWLRDGLAWYCQFILPAFRMLHAAATESAEYPQVAQLADRGQELAAAELRRREGR